jgi:predicted RNA binding protein YcfA (HicA-like mRNA interferase family)
MAATAPVKYKVFVKIAKAHGFRKDVGGKGSHEKWVNRSGVAVTVPRHGNEVPFYVVKQVKSS